MPAKPRGRPCSIMMMERWIEMDKVLKSGYLEVSLTIHLLINAVGTDGWHRAKIGYNAGLRKRELQQYVWKSKVP